MDECDERMMSLGLGLAVQIETSLDRVKPTLKAFGIGPVDPGKMVQSRQPGRWHRVPFLDGNRRCDAWRRGDRARTSG